MNNKGFTLVEMLAVVAILGMLTTLAAIAYSKYIDKTKDDAYKILAESAANAAEEYNMVHFGTTTVTLETLVEDQFLESVTDPNDKSKKCTGSVKITHKTNNTGLDTEYFDVVLLCPKHKNKYCFPAGTKISKDGVCITE